MRKKAWPRALRDSLPVSLSLTIVLTAQEHFTQPQHILFDYARTCLTQFPVMFLGLSIFSRFNFFGATDWTPPNDATYWLVAASCFGGLLLFDFLFPLPWHGGWESFMFVLGAAFVSLCMVAFVAWFRDASQEQK